MITKTGEAKTFCICLIYLAASLNNILSGISRPHEQLSFKYLWGQEYFITEDYWNIQLPLGNLSSRESEKAFTVFFASGIILLTRLEVFWATMFACRKRKLFEFFSLESLWIIWLIYWFLGKKTFHKSKINPLKDFLKNKQKFFKNNFKDFL